MKAQSITVAAVAAGALLAGSANGQPRHVKQIKVTLQNSVGIARPNEGIAIAVADLRKVAPDFNPASFIVTTSDAPTLEEDAKASAFHPLAFQADDLDGDGQPDEIAFITDFPPHSRKVVTINYGDEDLIRPLRIAFPKRAHAAFQQKYEGMGWESDRVAWRMYFDERNAFDMYGKRQHCLALDYFAQPGVDYHAESPIGRDTFKIGDALGIGSAGAFVDGKAVKIGDVADRKWKVIADGPVRAIFDLIYTGWSVGGKKVDITSRVTVWAGQHWFDHAIAAKGAEGITLVASLPKKPGVAFAGTPAKPEGGKTYYMATWGHQALMPGATATEALPDQNLGLIVIAQGIGPEGALSDAANYLVKVPLRVADGVATGRWRVFSAWDQEQPDGDTVTGIDPALTQPYALRSAEAWERYAYGMSQLYARPVSMRISSRVADGADGPIDTLVRAQPKSYSQAIEIMRADIDQGAELMLKAGPDGAPAFWVNRDNDTGERRADRSYGWTGAFWTGQLWKMYERTKDLKYAGWAKAWNELFLGHESDENHDTGFLNYYSSAFAFAATNEAKYKEGGLRAAARLKALYNPKTELCAAWTLSGDDSIIDTMMNLQILYWASKMTGDASWTEVARKHALKSAEWLVRDDGSVVQSVHYDPLTGAHRFGHTHQGLGEESSWGRGTGWGFYGFTIAARETKDPAILAAAEEIGAFVSDRLPKDAVAWHDFLDPGVYYRIKDTSAAALCANAWLNLSELVTDPVKAAGYRAKGEAVVQSLIDHYLTPVGGGDISPGGILRHGSGQRPSDNDLIFGDYYLLEALLWLDGHGAVR